MSDLVVPIKCKLCGAVIQTPPETPIVGQDPRISILRKIGYIVRHVLERAQAEAQNGKPSKPHYEALAVAEVAGQNMKGVMLSQHFELSPELEAHRERERAGLAAMTRKATMTDEEIEGTAVVILNRIFEEGEGASYTDQLKHVAKNLVDLRDRYEERGDYAPPEVVSARKFSTP